MDKGRKEGGMEEGREVGRKGLKEGGEEKGRDEGKKE